ncbi:MAG: hypothetical protein WB778_08275 [Thermoplasmata archaeon]
MLKPDEVHIRDVSRFGTNEWMPPIGAMGGPPAHELYRDLVLHAGLHLLKDDEGRPWVELLDGEHRRSFRVPSGELRWALDRFRMRRNLRPVPDHDIDDFARIVDARISDPDVDIPPVGDIPSEESTVAEREVAPELSLANSEAMMKEIEAEVGTTLQRMEPEADRPSLLAPPLDGALSWKDAPSVPFVAETRPPEALDLSISGGRLEAPASANGAPHYVHVLKDLVRNGGWLGTTSELSRLMGDEPERVFASLLQYRSNLAENDILVATVEVEDGWRWLAVARSQLRSLRGESRVAPP